MDSESPNTTAAELLLCSSGVMYRLQCRNLTEGCIAGCTPLLAGAGKGFPIKSKMTGPRGADLNKLGQPRGLSGACLLRVVATLPGSEPAYLVR